MSFFAELKRRNVFKVAIAYIVMAWLMMQVADVIVNNIAAPGWVFHVILLLLGIGFLLALFFAWAFELTPQGLMREHKVDRSQSIAHETSRKLDFVIIGVLVLALGYFAYDKFVLDASRDAALVEATTQAVSAQAAAEEASVESDKSIAVLSFVNMSDDASNEFFSDGLAEELINLLAKIPGLRVTSRSSAFSYKGKDFKIADVGRELNVSNVLEGSVRKAGNQVRITAQLIKVDGDVHLWSETFDRSLDNIFAIQDEIAAAVVAHLKVTLLGDVPMVRETDPEAYALYLQGRYLNHRNTAGALEQAFTLLQQALVIDPDNAAAWVELGAVYPYQANLGLRPIDESYTLSREAINKALAIDPEFAPALGSLGLMAMFYDNDLAAAAQHFERALLLEPANSDIIANSANLTAALGRLDESIALAKFVVARDPVNPFAHNRLGVFYAFAGRWDEAIASYSTALTLSPDRSGTQYHIGMALLFKGEPNAALEAMQLEDSVWGMIGLPLAYHALGRVGESDAALAELIEQYEQGAAYNIAYVLAYRGEADRAFEWLDKAVQFKDAGLAQILGAPFFANIHDDPRWLPFLERIGRSPEQLAAIEFKVSLPE
ncbi:MAG: tetratricopeptide repeat protein [Proteobacteria bacterium]|nr:tetratricopeptide repeat protein [Pseudomonadota bacterium]